MQRCWVPAGAARRRGSPGGSAPLRIRLGGGPGKGRGRGTGAGVGEEQRCLLTLKHRSSNGRTCRGGRPLGPHKSNCTESQLVVVVIIIVVVIVIIIVIIVIIIVVIIIVIIFGIYLPRKHILYPVLQLLSRGQVIVISDLHPDAVSLRGQAMGD